MVLCGIPQKIEPHVLSIEKKLLTGKKRGSSGSKEKIPSKRK